MQAQQAVHTLKILFISHDATRTGAPIVLLHFLKWLKQYTSVSFTVILGKGGELESEFRVLAPVHVWQKNETVPQGLEALIIKKIKNKVFNLNQHRKKLIAQLSTENYDLIYANTALTCKILVDLKPYLTCPVLCHIHELEIVLQTYCRLDKFIEAKPFIDRYVFAAEATKQNMVRNHGVDETVSEVVYEAVPIDKIRKPATSHAKIREELNLETGTFVVGAAGLVEWRKGTDLFITVAGIIRTHFPQHPPISFVWVGHMDELQKKHIRHDLEKAGLGQKVIFTGKKENPMDYFQVFDVFLLSSREDTFPLVCLEAAVLGKPIICFEESGGIPELISKGGGVMVPYLDVYALAKIITDLAVNPELVLQMSSQIQELVKAYDISVAGPRLLQIIYSVCSGLKEPALYP